VSITNNNNNRERRKDASFTLSCGSGLFIITSIIILAVGGFALIGTTATTTLMTNAAFAQEGSDNSTTATSADNSATATTTSNTSSGIQLSPQPIWQERATTVSMTPINQTHMIAAYSGNGTFTLPNTTETINFTANGSALVSLTMHTVQAKETLVTEQGETATATLYEIAKFNPATAGEGKGLTMAVIDTNSTGTLAPLNGTIVIGISDMQPNVETNVTLWEWESGIANSGVAPSPMQGGSSPMNTSTTTTTELPSPTNTP
jgi:hypothetical protein